MAEFKDNKIEAAWAEKIYESVKNLPIIDYHCHLSPKEIFEDNPFENLGELWLQCDHYKWRLMRSFGIEEKYITGDAPIKEKYLKFASVVSTAFNNPIKDWVALELKTYFGINLPLKAENAEEIWTEANRRITENSLSPRKLIAASNVKYIATTDDICDSLEWHIKLKDYAVAVVPSFRTDNLFLFDGGVYPTYIRKLETVSGVKIANLPDMQKALEKRLKFFVSLGCNFSDIGVKGFPSRSAEFDEADGVFRKLRSGGSVSDCEAQGFCGYMYNFLAGLYKRFGIIQQWHLGVTRNCNTSMFNLCGRDSGFDCVDDALQTESILSMLDRQNSAGNLPVTIIYTLNPTIYYPLATLCGAFENVHLGVAWWFNDHKRGITELLNTASELGHIKSLIGMLTDSRSFLSYIRHDYFRKTVAEYLAKFANDDNFDEIQNVANSLCFDNINNLLGGVYENNI